MHVIEVLYDEVAIPKSPFRVSVVEGCDPTRVRAYGPGLEGGLINTPNCFTVETRYNHSKGKDCIHTANVSEQVLDIK
jgi:filamin